MLKGLALRQTFLVVNILLILLLGAVLAGTVSEFLAAPADVGPVSSPPDRDRSGEITLTGARPLEDYDLIVYNRLFGNAAFWDAVSLGCLGGSPFLIPDITGPLSKQFKLPLLANLVVTAGQNYVLMLLVVELCKLREYP